MVIPPWKLSKSQTEADKFALSLLPAAPMPPGLYHLVIYVANWKETNIPDAPDGAFTLPNDSALVGATVVLPHHEERPTLLILDRSHDPMSPLLHEYTYQAMAHDLLSVQEERYKYSYTGNNNQTLSKEVLLNDTTRSTGGSSTCTLRSYRRCCMPSTRVSSRATRAAPR